MIKWGILGAGRMAWKFASNLKKKNNCIIEAIASQNGKKIKKFSNEFGINKNSIYSNYEEILKIKAIDAVYISTTNNYHKELIDLCLKYQKHILCEKPICVSYDETTNAINNIKKNKKFFLEAIAYRYHNQTQKVLELIKEENIGKIKKLELRFGIKNEKINPSKRLHNKKLGGGAILDLGCYPISFSNLLIKKISGKYIKPKIENIESFVCYTGVELEAKCNLIYENFFQSSVEISILNNLNNDAIIEGEKKKIIIEKLWQPEKQNIIYIVDGNNSRKEIIKSEKNGFEEMIDYFTAKILKNDLSVEFPHLTIEEIEQNMFIIDQFKKKLFKQHYES